MIILKVTKNQGFTLSLEDTSFEKPHGGWGGWGGGGCHPPPAIFRVKGLSVAKNCLRPESVPLMRRIAVQ